AFDLEAIVTELVDLGLSPVQVARVREDDFIKVSQNGSALMSATRTELEQQWSSPSHQVQRMRDNP
ncbi:MAG TPA: hypothetical protein DEQ32_09740, partial [Gammaproteobacteria bacterium]|nr:hypothetical protein [Gammaproteobacteria bacterium]